MRVGRPGDPLPRPCRRAGGFVADALAEALTTLETEGAPAALLAGLAVPPGRGHGLPLEVFANRLGCELYLAARRLRHVGQRGLNAPKSMP